MIGALFFVCQGRAAASRCAAIESGEYRSFYSLWVRYPKAHDGRSRKGEDCCLRSRLACHELVESVGGFGRGDRLGPPLGRQRGPSPDASGSFDRFSIPSKMPACADVSFEASKA